jgi:CofH/MqnC C-terminal region
MVSPEGLATLVEAVTGALASATEPDPAQVAALAATTDVLALGALADDARRARHGGRTTFVRVHELDVTAIDQWTPPPAAATEVRLIGRPADGDAAVASVRQARALAGARAVRGFWLGDLEPLGDAGLGELRAAGLDEVAFVNPASHAAIAVARARAAGLGVQVIAIDQATPSRLGWLLDARRLVEAAGGIIAVAPLPRHIDRATPTTGFDDVRTVALARLILTTVPSIQVDWTRYGPKLAQVALVVGADDLDAVSPLDDAALGPRRVAVEEVRRNITAAGQTPIERDGRWTATAR